MSLLSVTLPAAARIAPLDAGFLLAEGGGARPRIDDILRERQVADDRMVDWKPKLGGLIPLPVGGRKITETEADMLDRLTFHRGLVGLNEFRGIYDQAFEVSRARVAEGALDGHQDAFRHAFWSARLTQAFGAEWARAFTTAHEAVPGNTAGVEAMDLYNNSVGIRIAEANPYASADDLARLIEQALNNGELLVIDQAGNLAWSNEVARGFTGVDRLPPANGVIPVPDSGARIGY